MPAELSTWQEGKTRQTIVDFVTAVSDKTSPSFVPAAERIAVFDNDGTLWCEKPAYIQLFFAIHRLQAMAQADPSLLQKPAFKAAADNDMAYFAGLYPDKMQDLLQIVFDTHAGMNQREFQRLAYDFLSQVRHPRFDRVYKECTYAPMVELLHYLRRHDFKVFVASAGGMSFVRTVSEEIYALPREHVIGSNVTFELGRSAGKVFLLRKPGLVLPVDDGPGKPANIELHIGRPPILVGGNANGDLEMMEYTASGDRPFLNLLLNHDDAEREYVYEQGAEALRRAAREHDWTVISMKADWHRVFAWG